MTIVNTLDPNIAKMTDLGFSATEAKIYLYLLQHTATHAQISIATGINRTTLYRIIHRLQDRGLVVLRIDDRGKFLVATEPSALEVEVINQESRAKQQRAALNHLLPELLTLQETADADFAVQTYTGVDGFKRMLWNELKTRGDCLCIGSGTLEDLVGSRWAEKHRSLSAEANYKIREMSNPGTIPANFTNDSRFLEQYEHRIIDRDILAINYLITVCNDTVSIYHKRYEHRRGLEIVSHMYAETMRSMFEQAWCQAAPIASRQAAHA